MSSRQPRMPLVLLILTLLPGAGPVGTLARREPTLRQALHDYFAWATTTTMAQYPESVADVPDGLVIAAEWSWHGQRT